MRYPNRCRRSCGRTHAKLAARAYFSSGSPGWSVDPATYRTGPGAAFAPDPATIGDQQLTLSSPIVIPSNASRASLTWGIRPHLDNKQR